MKANLFARLVGCRDQLLDCLEDNGELLVVFFLERFDLAGEIAICIHKAAELHERPHMAILTSTARELRRMLESAR